MPKRGEPFDASKGNRFAVLTCPVCLEDGAERALMVQPRLAKEPNKIGHTFDHIETISYDYRCGACGLILNYPWRLKE